MQSTLKGKEDHKKEDEELGIWDCGSPLYDSYELVSVSHLIERHMMALPSMGGSGRFITDFSRSSNEMASLRSSRSEMRREPKGCISMVGGLSELKGIRRIWKKKTEKSKKKMKTGLSGFCNLIGLWRQKDQHR